MVKIAPYSLSSRVSFKNNQENPVKQQTQNSEYYKTTSGVKTAAGYAASGLVAIIVSNHLVEKMSNKFDEISKLHIVCVTIHQLHQEIRHFSIHKDPVM